MGKGEWGMVPHSRPCFSAPSRPPCPIADCGFRIADWTPRCRFLPQIRNRQSQSAIQGDRMGAVLDLFNVLLEPTAVFERVREKPKFLAPFLVIGALQMIIGFLNLPLTQAAMHAIAASRPAAPAGAAHPAEIRANGLP